MLLGTKPTSFDAFLNNCEIIPPFHLLDEIRGTEGATMKLYSDASYVENDKQSRETKTVEIENSVWKPSHRELEKSKIGREHYDGFFYEFEVRRKESFEQPTSPDVPLLQAFATIKTRFATSVPGHKRSRDDLEFAPIDLGETNLNEYEEDENLSETEVNVEEKMNIENELVPTEIHITSEPIQRDTIHTSVENLVPSTEDVEVEAHETLLSSMQELEIVQEVMPLDFDPIELPTELSPLPMDKLVDSLQSTRSSDRSTSKPLSSKTQTNVSQISGFSTLSLCSTNDELQLLLKTKRENLRKTNIQLK